MVVVQLLLAAPLHVYGRHAPVHPAGLSLDVSVLRDSLSRFSIGDVTADSLQQAYLPDSTVKYDLSSRTYWLRVTVKGENRRHEYWTVKLSHIDTIQMYLPEPDGSYHRLISGENIPFWQRAVPYGEYTCMSFPVYDTSTTFYLRLTSASMYSFDFRRIGDMKFMPPETFAMLSHEARYFHGIFFGIMLAMIVFNFIIYLMYRYRPYLVYAGFMVTQTIYQLSVSGFLKEFVFYNMPLVGKHSPFYTAVISLAGYVYFCRVYLESSKYAPRMDRIYKWVYLVLLADMLVGVFYNLNVGNNLLLLSGLVIIIFPFFMAITAIRQKYRQAVYFLLSSILSYIGYFLYVGMKMEVVPQVFFTRYSFQMFFGVQSLLFATGLADRMNLIRKELEQKKLEKARLEKEQEIALKNILEKQNEELEIKVQERTIELEEKNREIEHDREIIRQERVKSDNLLLNIMPEKIARRLKAGEKTIAETFDNVTVLFCDIVGFTKLSKVIGPQDLVMKLNAIFSEFDQLATQYGLEKIKTIGDAYMCVCGLPEPKPDHAERTAMFALGMLDAIKQHENELTGGSISVRIGINSGMVVAGVIGNQKFAYDLWGETVNTASRLESQGESMKIQCSEATYELLSGKFSFEERGDVELKGMGMAKAYFLTGRI